MDDNGGNDKKFSSYTHSDGRTGIKQRVSFTCCSEDVDEVKKFLREKVRTIEVETTHTVNVSHGGYGRYSRYQIVQHKYAGGGEGGCCGYIEVLEIKDAPKGRCPFVIHEWTSDRGECFTEWETLADALAAWEKSWSSHSKPETFVGLHGFKRRVECGALSSWFYATGEEELIGDYAVPYGIEDDPVFRLGKKFVVVDSDGAVAVKTCMGTRFVREVPGDYYGRSEQKVRVFRLVYWDDGTVWDERYAKERAPRLLDEKEVWIAEALAQFRAVLAGKQTGFTINFTNGTKFFGGIREGKPRANPEGRYFAIVHLSDGTKQEGWFNFKPTPDAPDAITFLNRAIEKKYGVTVKKVTIKEKQTTKKGKKWAGVFLSPQ